MNEDDPTRPAAVRRATNQEGDTVDILIEVEELATLIGDDPQLVLADVRWRLGGPPGEPEFEAGHLPGARYVDLETELTGPHGTDPSTARPGGRHPLPSVDTFQSAMRRIGIDSDSLVVIYDDANALAAARMWWLLSDAGLAHIRVLNGGLGAWTATGRPLITGPADLVPIGDFRARPGQRAQIDATTLASEIDSVKAPTVIDVRAHERFTGASEPMDPVAGHIPAAVNLASMANLDEHGRFRSSGEIRERYRAIDAEEGTPIFYCGSGITAAHTLLARESAGLTDGLIYPGSWSDWISDPARPVATGG